MIVFDTTGNVKKCCCLICECWGWIINCPDVLGASTVIGMDGL